MQRGEHDLSSALDPHKVLSGSDYTLPPGQLTSRGFMQHIDLGQLLHGYYATALLNQVTSSSQLYVRSTNYARTVQVRDNGFQLCLL